MKKFIIRYHFLLLYLGLADICLAEKSANSKVAILGDSLSTGAATHSALAFDGDSLWDVFKHVVSVNEEKTPEISAFLGPVDLGKPGSLWYSEREFRGGMEWVFRHFFKRLSNEYLNTGAYSWGYLAARKVGFSPENILIAGENGARMADLSRQIDRVLDATQKRLPEKIYILFSGNDLCATHIKLLTPPESYKKSLLDGLKYLFRNGEPAANGTEVIVVGFLGVTQLLVSEEILDKNILAFGQQMSCRQLRAKNYQSPILDPTKVRNEETVYFSHMMPPNPSGYCPTLFALPMLARGEVGLFSGTADTKPEQDQSTKKNEPWKLSGRTKARVDEMVSLLSGRVRQFRTASVEAVREALDWARNDFPSKNIKISYLYDTEKLVFEADDIAQDCFHLSPKGHIKIAKKLIEHQAPGEVISETK